MKTKPILVTGGCGYIGSHVVLELTQRGYSVVVLDNLSTGFARFLIGGEELIQGNVGDAALLKKIFSEREFSAVLHFAGSTSVPESVENPLKYYENNTQVTAQLLRAMNDAGVPHLVFSSTAAVYGEKHAEPVTEEAPLTPLSPYGSSKLVSEWMIRDLTQASALTSVTLRYFNVAGADPQSRLGQLHTNATHLIRTACRTALGKRAALTIFGNDYPTSDGTGVRDYIHVVDLAHAHVLALEYLLRGGKPVTLNCGYGRGFSVLEVIEAVKAMSGESFAVHIGARRAGDIPSLVSNAHRIVELLDWKPRFDDLNLIVRHTLDWEKNAERG